MRNSNKQNTRECVRIPATARTSARAHTCRAFFSCCCLLDPCFVCSLAEKYTLYMGRDKIENEDLIKFGWSQDVWFHVSNLSSAHVYLRMEDGMTLKQIPPRQFSDPGETGACARMAGHCSCKAITLSPGGSRRASNALSVGKAARRGF